MTRKKKNLQSLIKFNEKIADKTETNLKKKDKM